MDTRFELNELEERIAPSLLGGLLGDIGGGASVDAHTSVGASLSVLGINVGANADVGASVDASF